MFNFVGFSDFVFDNLDSISPLLVIISTLLLIKSREESFIMVVFVIVELVLNLFATLWIAFFKQENNLIFYKLNALFSIILINQYFKNILTILKKSVLIKITVTITGILIGSTAFLESDKALNSYSYSIISLVVIFFSLSYYYGVLNNPSEESLVKSSRFWIITGLFIYYTSSIFIYLVYTIVYAEKINPYTLWKFHNTVFSIMCIFLIIGFSCSTSQNTQQ